MIYKKGQIIPRRLVRCKNRKTQHLWRFGSDVEVIGREVRILSYGEGIFTGGGGFIGGKHGKPLIINVARINNVKLMSEDKSRVVLIDVEIRDDD